MSVEKPWVEGIGKPGIADAMLAPTTNGTLIRMIGVPICPDLLDYAALGEADNWRGRVVRGFFWVMRWWPT
jgi:hypothetical protein